jgi:hypothetical protein
MYHIILQSFDREYKVCWSMHVNDMKAEHQISVWLGPPYYVIINVLSMCYFVFTFHELSKIDLISEY